MRTEPKPRVPPFRELPKLLALTKEKQEKEERDARLLAKQKERENAGEEEEKKEEFVPKEELNKFDIIDHYDYPTNYNGTNYVEYDEKEISLYEIFQNYGTVARPKVDPKDDPEEPPKKEKKKPPTPPPKKEDEGEGEGEGEGENQKPPVEEEPEEEPFIPPVEKELWYDFKAHNGKEPILLALMVKGDQDKFTL